MEHVAIMSKKWKLIEEILTGKKVIESRWYKSRKAPWNTLNEGDTVYFKYSGEQVFAKAQAECVLKFAELNEQMVNEIFKIYGEALGLKNNEILSWIKNTRDKRYCVLIVLKNPEKVIPFNINKKGYGSSCAWISTNDINTIKQVN